jgi:hypothetical protein
MRPAKPHSHGLTVLQAGVYWHAKEQALLQNDQLVVWGCLPVQTGSASCFVTCYTGWTGRHGGRTQASRLRKLSLQSRRSLARRVSGSALLSDLFPTLFCGEDPLW